jgi:hypothetical protein
MGAMGLPERLAGRNPANQSDARVGKVVERQQQRRGRLSPERQSEQQPAELQSDGQAADVAEKELGHRLVEGCKADRRPE